MLNLAKTFGGKGTPRVLNWVLSNFPPNYQQLRFLETHAGGINVTLNKDASVFEAVNDIDPSNCEMLRFAKEDKISGYVKNIDYNKIEFNNHLAFKNSINGFIEYVLRNMSRSGMKKDFAWSERKRGGKPGDLNAWENKIKKLPQIAQRLKNVQIYNMDAIDFMRQFNDKNTFAYLDPPYLHETRVSKKVYEHEMTKQQHEDLLKFLASEWKGLFLISGYSSLLYDNFFPKLGCTYSALSVSNSSGQTKKKNHRLEVLWKNY